jgi:quercetin dioxygenase-like cupin family protein
VTITSEEIAMTLSATVIHSEPSPGAPGLRHRVSAGLLGGTTSIHEGLLAPGALIPPHTHANEDQCIYVVSGTVHLEIGGEFIQAPAGTYVIKPRGVPHGFWNSGSTPALVLEITSPGGFEPYYQEIAAVTSPAQAVAVQAKYGITFHGDLATQLISRHQLHLGYIPQNWR